MSVSAYPDYKDSGVPWLGAVPTHWEVAQFKRLVEIQNGADYKHVEQSEGYPVIGSGGPFTFASDYLHDGESVLLGRKGTVDKPLHVTGRFWTVDTMFWTKIRQGVSGRYAYYTALTIPFSYYSTSTALPSMTQGALNGHLVGLPTEDEQTAIAAFLDRETAKIDRLVAEQERLIALLKEKRQAVISHAVTKGLNGQAPMKDSGIEWLGEIPAHWIVSKLFHGAKLQSGYAFASADFGSDGVPVVRMNNLSRGKLDLSEAVRIPESALMPAVALSKGDLVWGMSGSVGETGSLGNFAIVSAEDLPCQLNQRVGRFVVNTSRMTAEFLEIWIQSYPFYQQILLAVTGTAQYNVSAEQVQSTMIGFPPIEEQLRICEHVASVVYSFGELLAEAQSAITLLQERRAALISAAVTGKIDVRGLAETSQELELA